LIAGQEILSMATHLFEADLQWQAHGEGAVAGNHPVRFGGKPALEVSAAPQYRGDASKLNPEELLVAAVASCQLLTYLALARRAEIQVVAYEDHAVGTLAVADRKMRMTEVVLRPRIVVAGSVEIAKARELVEAAHQGCFIANSISCAVRIEPELVHGG
jgi:peroxiredoxin-like protein